MRQNFKNIISFCDAPSKISKEAAVLWGITPRKQELEKYFVCTHFCGVIAYCISF